MEEEFFRISIKLFLKRELLKGLAREIRTLDNSCRPTESVSFTQAKLLKEKSNLNESIKTEILSESKKLNRESISLESKIAQLIPYRNISIRTSGIYEGEEFELEVQCNFNGKVTIQRIK